MWKAQIWLWRLQICEILNCVIFSDAFACDHILSNAAFRTNLNSPVSFISDTDVKIPSRFSQISTLRHLLVFVFHSYCICPLGGIHSIHEIPEWLRGFKSATRWWAVNGWLITSRWTVPLFALTYSLWASDSMWDWSLVVPVYSHEEVIPCDDKLRLNESYLKSWQVFDGNRCQWCPPAIPRNARRLCSSFSGTASVA